MIKLPGKLPGGKALRQALLILLLIGFVVVVTRQFTDFASLASIASTARWQWLVVALGLHVLYYLAYPLLYRAGFLIVGVDVPIGSLLANFFASDFVNAVAPLGGAGSAAIFIDNAVSHGQSGARTAAGILLVLILDLVTSLPFIGYGVVYLAQKGDLAPYDVVITVFFTIFIGLLIAVLALSYANVSLTRRVFGWLGAAGNRVAHLLRRRRLVRDGWASENAAQFSLASEAVAASPVKLLLATHIGLLLHVVNILGLWALFVAFDQAISPGVVVAGFGLSTVYAVVSVLKGVGVVEYIVSLVFASGGVAEPRAIAITLAFRGLTYWMPLLIGLVFVSRAPTFSGRSRAGARQEVELG